MGNNHGIKFSENFLERLKRAYQVVVLTGAGISAGSGVPTFRGKDGLWNKFKPQELANVEAFLNNPDLVWEWYRWRRHLIQNVQPNLGHYALVDLENRIPNFTIITQNVDNLHQIAGSRNVIELHGNILRNKCLKCGEIVEDPLLEEEKTPHCEKCGGLIRPDVVWFGELLPPAAIEAAQKVAAATEILLVVGTSATVEPAASLPFLAKANGAYVLEINPEKTPLTAAADESIHLPADTVLPVLSIQLEKILGQKSRTKN